MSGVITFFTSISGFLLGVLAGAVLTLIFEEFVFEPLIAPSLRYRFRYWRAQFSKNLSDHRTSVTLTAKSETFSEKLLLDKFEIAVRAALQDLEVKVTMTADDVFSIKEYKYGGVEMAGEVRTASIPSANGFKVDSFEVVLSSEIKYRRFYPGIIALMQAQSKIKEALNRHLQKPLSYSDFLTSSLSRVVELTGVLSAFKPRYMKLAGGEVEVSLGERTVTYNKVLGEETVESLRQLVTLYD